MNATVRLQNDFLDWSGGWPPESEDQVTVYLDYALDVDVDYETARSFVLEWFQTAC